MLPPTGPLKKKRPSVPAFGSSPEPPQKASRSEPPAPSPESVAASPAKDVAAGMPGISNGEWERRLKAGLVDAYDPANPGAASGKSAQHDQGATPTAFEVAQAQLAAQAQAALLVVANAVDKPSPQSTSTPPVPGSLAALQQSTSTPAAEPTTVVADASDVPNTPVASDDSNPPASGTSSSSAPSKGNSAKADGDGAADPLANLLGKAPKISMRSVGVYGFQAPSSDGRGGVTTTKEAQKKAIALRLDPLAPGLPSFERVLSEDRQSITIGSNRKLVDVAVVDDAVSKKHCTLSLVGVHGQLALCVVDHSTNGTYLNNERLPAKQKKYRVNAGDKLVLKHPDLDKEFGWTCDFGNTVAFFSR